MRGVKIIDVLSFEIIDVNFRFKAGSKYRCLFSSVPLLITSV